MKTKLILIVVFLFSTILVKGQGGDGGLLQKCCIDSKTGDTVLATFWFQIDETKNYLLNFRMKRKNSVYTLELKYHFGRSDPFSVERGDSVWVKFVGGYKTAIYANDSATSRRGGAKIPERVEGSVTQGVAVNYNLSRHQTFVFAGNEIEKVRIFSSKGYNDIDWPDYIQGGGETRRSLTVSATKLLLEKRKKYKICDPEPEPVNIKKENANKDGF